jgi:two-component system LytT family response regulator
MFGRLTRLRVMVVDEDASSRRTFRALLASYPDVEIVGDRCGRGVMDTIKDCLPDLMFVGVEALVTAMDCVGMVKAHQAGILPVTILMGPDSKYSPEEFDARGFSYLTMPISRDRLLEVLHNARVYIRSQSPLGDEREVGARLQSTARLPRKQDRIVIRSAGRFVFVRAQEIEWIEAEGNNVRVHVENKSYVQRKSISAVERELDPATFSRIHRSAIVNLDKIRELRPWSTGEYVVLMRNGKELTLSRGYRARLPVLLGETERSEKHDAETMFPQATEDLAT